MIPKKIHQTAKTADISPYWQPYQERVQALHPDWEYQLWTDEDNDRFVRAEFPYLHEIFVQMPMGIMRADVIRYLLMYRIGGLYLDLDYEMLKPFDLNEYSLVLPWSRTLQYGDRRNYVGNCVFASSPGHPFWEAVIEELTINPPIYETEYDVRQETGPGFLTKIYNRLQAAGKEMDIYMPDRPYFHPKTPFSEAEHGAIKTKGVAYGIHHCHNTWMQSSSRHEVWQTEDKREREAISQRLIRRLRRIWKERVLWPG